MTHAVELGGLRLSVIDQGDGTYALAAQNLNTGASPSNSVVAETTAGASPSAGNAATYSRGNHTHGTPAANLDTTISQGGGSVSVDTDGNISLQPPTGERAVVVGEDGSISIPFDASTGFDAYDFGSTYCDLSMSAGVSFLAGGASAQTKIQINADGSIDLSVAGTTHLTIAATGAVTLQSASGAALTMDAAGVIALGTANGVAISLNPDGSLSVTGGGETDLAFDQDGSVALRANTTPAVKVGTDGKLGFFGGTPAAKPTIVDNAASLGNALVALGLVADGR